MSHLGHVVVQRLLGGRLGKPYRANPAPVGTRPGAAPLAGGSGLVPDVPPLDQQMRQAVLGPREVVSDVLERTREAPRGPGLLVGDEHLDHVVGEELAGQELGVVPAVLLPPVAGGPVHLGDRADDAVDAEAPELADEMEAGDAGFVDGLRGFESEDPRGYLSESVRKLPRANLSRIRIQCDGSDGTGVNIQAD